MVSYQIPSRLVSIYFLPTNIFFYRIAFPMDIDLTTSIGYYSRSGVLKLEKLLTVKLRKSMQNTSSPTETDFI